MTEPQHHDIVVIGAGICGAAITNELLERGKDVCIIDAASSPATACSNHAYAIAHPHIGKGAPRLLRLTRIAFLLAEARWQDVWQQHGIFQPTKKDKAFNHAEVTNHLRSLELDQDMAIAMDAQEALKVCGIKQSGVWLPRGAGLNLPEASKRLLQDHERLTCLWSTRVERLEAQGNRWHLLNASGQMIATANKVVVACAMEAKALMGTIGIRLPLRPVRGQLSIFRIKEDAEGSSWIEKLPKVGISGDGYCLPAERLDDGSYQWIVGSSFDEGEDDLAPREASDDFNREQARSLLNYPEGNLRSLTKAGEFVGVRCVAGDRLPIIGALTQRPGIFLATALGSRGILWSALAAKLITAQLLEDDFALLARFGFAADLVAALAPARFFAGAAPSALGALASNSKPIFPAESKAK
jgi:tRNA 5-methylaminomethyl-2-thiouridine biosynthesis bifunctional protein